MSKVKINENQFLGKHELNRALQFVSKDGYKSLFQQSVATFGVVKLPVDENFLNLKIQQGTNNSYISINPGLAINKDIERIIVADFKENILSIPNDNVFRKVVIKHSTNNTEEGTVDLAVNGDLIGTNTKFTEVLRGQPNHPVKIKLLNSSNNTQEYEVFSIDSDTSAKIIGASFTVENNLKYRVVGTFAPNVGVPVANKNIYIFDSYELTLKDSSYELDENLEFYLADVKTDGSNMVIQDRRSNNLYSLNFTNSVISEEQLYQSNPNLGVESVKYDHLKSSKAQNIVTVGWGLRSDIFGWTPDPQNNKLTIDSLSGFGLITNLNQIPDDSLIDWRVYFSNGKYRKVASNSFDGTELIVFINDFNTSEISLDGIVTIVPDIDFIEFKFSSGVFNKNIQYLYHISRGYAEVRVPAGGAIVGRYKNILNDKISNYFDFNNGVYFNESAFNENGIKINNNLSQVFDATFTVASHEDNFFDKKGWIDKDNEWTGENDFNNYVKFNLQAIVGLSGELINQGNLSFLGNIFHYTGNTVNINTIFNNFPYFGEKSKVDVITSSGSVINGIEHGVQGKIITVYVKDSSSSSGLLFKHNSNDADPGNRILLPLGKKLSLTTGQNIKLIYAGGYWRYYDGSKGFDIVVESGLQNKVIDDYLIQVQLFGEDIGNTNISYKNVRYRILDNMAFFQVRVEIDWTDGSPFADIKINKIEIGFPSIFNSDNVLDTNNFIDSDGRMQLVGTIEDQNGVGGSNMTANPCHVEIKSKIGVDPPKIIVSNEFTGNDWTFVDNVKPIKFTCSFALFLNT